MARQQWMTVNTRTRAPRTHASTGRLRHHQRIPSWISDWAGACYTGLQGDFNMTGNYDEREEAPQPIERELSDYGGDLPDTESPESGSGAIDWQSVPPVRVRFRQAVRAGPEAWSARRRSSFHELRPARSRSQTLGWKGNLVSWAAHSVSTSDASRYEAGPGGRFRARVPEPP